MTADAPSTSAEAIPDDRTIARYTSRDPPSPRGPCGRSRSGFRRRVRHVPAPLQDRRGFSVAYGSVIGHYHSSLVMPVAMISATNAAYPGTKYGNNLVLGKLRHETSSQGVPLSYYSTTNFGLLHRHGASVGRLRPGQEGSRLNDSYFEELDYRPTPIGALSLRRRRELSLGIGSSKSSL